MDGLVATRLTRNKPAKGRELICRRAHGLAAANPCHVVGVAVARAAVALRDQVAGCVGAGIAVGVYKSAGCRVVVTALEVV